MTIKTQAMRHFLLAAALLATFAGAPARADEAPAEKSSDQPVPATETPTSAKSEPAPTPAEKPYDKTIPVAEDEKHEDRPRRHESVTYSGIGLTRVSTDFDNLKDAVNLNLTLGFRVPTFDMFGAEVEISTTIIPGENKGNPSTGTCGTVINPQPCPSAGGKNTTDPDELQMNNIAVYGVFRSPGRFYGMGKFGYRYLNTSIDELSAQNRSGTAYGGGVGYRWGESLSGVELFYTRFSDQVDYVGFTLAYGFDGRDRDRD